MIKKLCVEDTDIDKCVSVNEDVTVETTRIKNVTDDNKNKIEYCVENEFKGVAYSTVSSE